VACFMAFCSSFMELAVTLLFFFICEIEILSFFPLMHFVAGCSCSSGSFEISLNMFLLISLFILGCSWVNQHLFPLERKDIRLLFSYISFFCVQWTLFESPDNPLINGLLFLLSVSFYSRAACFIFFDTHEALFYSKSSCRLEVMYFLMIVSNLVRILTK
jgi:hypothetical protein